MQILMGAPHGHLPQDVQSEALQAAQRLIPQGVTSFDIEEHHFIVCPWEEGGGYTLAHINFGRQTNVRIR